MNRATTPTGGATAGTAVNESGTPRRPSVLPGGVELVGDVRGKRDFVVFGSVEGNIDIAGLLIVEQGGRVDGRVRARAVTVRGAVTADIHAAESIRVEATGVVVGDLTAPAIHVDDGAHVLGALQASLPGEAEATLSRTRTAAPEIDGGVPAVTSQRAGLLLIQARARGRGTAQVERGGPPPPKVPALGRMRARRRSASAEGMDDCLSGYER